MFEEIENETFGERENRILTFWKKEGIFQQSLKNREGGDYFSFYDGPPFATGLPHYGHLLASIIKDVIPRYKTMKGHYVPRRFGWDCHGLPVEQEIEKKFELSGAASIEVFGIDRFNEECRKIVFRYSEEWEKTINRIGRWVDFSASWHTMDLTYMESVWWVFKSLFDMGLVYKGFKVMPYSAKLGTPLSNFEAGENYKEVDDPSVVVAFPLEEDSNTALLVWTTTPWTLVSNLAATVGEEIDYVTIEDKESQKRYIVAKEAVPRLFKDRDAIVQLSTCKGKDFVGKHYTPPFNYFIDERKKGAFRVIADDFVSIEDGTGIVHTAPAFGEADFYACQKAKIDLVMPIDANGHFTHEVPEYAGLFVKEADKSIIKRLKEKGRIFSHATIHHRYPFCWRSDTPLIYKAVDTWFVAVEKLKERLVAANEQIHWVPGHLKEGRFGNWLEGARDWAISRNRYFGTPIPIWKSDDGELIVMGSCQELEALTGTKIDDLHRHHIDKLIFTKAGKTFKRITEVFDCWFDTGSAPYAQNHYPFENKEFTKKTFPADFIAEGVDQTRGWFYTLTVLAAALFEKPAFKNVIVNGLLLAEDGNKMSKRLKNYPEPTHVIEKYGADAVRLYMLHSPAVKADDLRFVEKGVEVCLRQILIPLWNAHAFFLTYARIYHFTPSQRRQAPESVIDKWILSRLHTLIKSVEEGMDGYDLSRAVDPFVGFIDDLTNWYIRRSRRRFWANEESLDRRQAFETLHAVLVELSKIAAPFVPFLSEALYQNLCTPEMPKSVHLTDFPNYDSDMRALPLEEGMDALQIAVSMGHSLRKEHKIKVRQPLPAVHIVSIQPATIAFLDNQKHLIQDELNVKKVHFHSKKREFVKHTVKPNFRVLGKKVGKHMKEAQLVIKEFDEETINHLSDGGSTTLVLGGETFILTSEDVEIGHTVQEGWIAMNVGFITIALDTTLTEELLLEGIARELVNKINTMRRDANFSVTDRIKAHIGATERVKKALLIHGDYVKEEVLAKEMLLDSHGEGKKWDINGEPTAIFLEKVVY